MKKWIVGIIIILFAVSGAAYYWLDDDPATNPDVPATIEKVKEGIDVIRDNKKAEPDAKDCH